MRHNCGFRLCRPSVRIPLRRCSVSVGIDLGTCNSVISVLETGKPRIISFTGEKKQIPSTVISTEKGLIPLWEAEIEQELDPSCVISNTKRLIGRPYSSVGALSSQFPFALKEGVDNSIIISTPLQRTSTEEVAGVILKSLVHVVEKELDQSVDSAVITIPAHFSAKQKAATLTAASFAGINTVALLQEPIAAALAYGLGRLTDHDYILVLDVGGGTYDVSILSSFEGILEVISFAGNQSLGGLDFDRDIADWIRIQTASNKIDSRLDLKVKRELSLLAEKVKIEIIEKQQSHFYFHGVDLCLDLHQFNSITSKLSDKLLQPILEAGKEAMIDWHPLQQTDALDPYQPPPKAITRVVLAGGSSRLPSLHEIVFHLTGLHPEKFEIDPKLCVAYGAGIFAGMLEGSIDGVEIMDGDYSQALHNRVTGII